MMVFQQHYLACLSQASYLIGDRGSRTAVVVDPRRDVELYLDEAAKNGLEIRHVFLTHFHADFVAGHLELAERCGAEIHLGARARTEYAFTPHADGSVLELGRVRLEVLETPGHTPESITLLVYDLDRSERDPYAMLTGDTLFLGDVGRPDLLVSVGMTAGELASTMYDSLREKILPLPDETLVYPGHGAGSACGKKLSDATVATLGSQKAANWALRPQTRERFVAELTSGQGSAPAYFAFDADLNKRRRPTLATDRLRPLPLEEALRLANSGAALLDVREPDDYAQRHLAGSLNIGLSGRYAAWCGEILRPDQTIVLIAPPGREREAATRLGRIGFDRVAGFVEGGEAAFATRPELVRSHRRIDPAELRALLASPRPPLVVDVRATSEWDAGHIAGARNEPLPGLRETCSRLPRETTLVVQCLGGYRSSIACSLLEQAGFTRLLDLRGGWRAWTGSDAAANA